MSHPSTLLFILSSSKLFKMRNKLNEVPLCDQRLQNRKHGVSLDPSLCWAVSRWSTWWRVFEAAIELKCFLFGSAPCFLNVDLWVVGGWAQSKMMGALHLQNIKTRKLRSLLLNRLHHVGLGFRDSLRKASFSLPVLFQVYCWYWK